MDILKLRMHGYSADESGIVCYRSDARFAHERTGILQIDLSRDTRAARSVVDSIVAAVDEPRALRGTARNGSSILLFRADRDVGINNSRCELGLPSGEAIVVTFGSKDQGVDPDSYNWAKGRSPFDVPRESLPVLHQEIEEIASRAARDAGARLPHEIALARDLEERGAKNAADFAAGRLKIPTPEEEREARDDELVAANEGRDIAQSDGNWARVILDARRRVAARLRKASEAA